MSGNPKAWMFQRRGFECMGLRREWNRRFMRMKPSYAIPLENRNGYLAAYAWEPQS